MNPVGWLALSSYFIWCSVYQIVNYEKIAAKSAEAADSWIRAYKWGPLHLIAGLLMLAGSVALLVEGKHQVGGWIMLGLAVLGIVFYKRVQRGGIESLERQKAALRKRPWTIIVRNAVILLFALTAFIGATLQIVGLM